MLQQTLRLIKLWQTLQTIGNLEEQFGDVRLSECKRVIEKENKRLIKDINALSKAIKRKERSILGSQDEIEEDIVLKVLRSIFIKDV